ncbi:hypothetical protein SAMN05421833_103262 [Microbispora rosea]|uniref:Uncharacterized protein n=1 Tax=Microbispora rosea TaxID=58117 RepID=A0A1N6V3Q6_9ACTN|nr:hypothetical protein [Microbispora rosea]GIH46761.1 hypothetical protein Mro03_19400 [Microbispora rosea subsp. rosea]SIQ72503.1 hypothetical protein SAMN05421833_103262 [Microbispora rosea]
MSEHLARYLETLSRTQHALSSGFRALRRGHPREYDLCGVCERLAAQCRDHTERLEPFLRRYRSGGLRDPRPAQSQAPGVRPQGLEAPGLAASGFDSGGFDVPGFTTGFDAGFDTGFDAGFDAGGFDSGFDAGRFDTGAFDAGRFDAAGFDRGRLDTGGLDAGGFDAGAFDAASIDGGGFEAAGLETADLPRAVRRAVEREREVSEGSEAGTARRPRVTPGPGGGDGGGLALLRDLHGLYLLATGCDLSWSVVAQAARGLRDDDLLGLARDCAPETAVQLLWLRTRMHQAAPQVLVVPSRSQGNGDKGRH